MSSSDRRAVLSLAAGFTLAACGFTPVHAPGGAGEALRGRILADAPDNRLSYAFVARVEDRLGRADSPDWALGYAIETEEIELGIAAANITTRFNVVGRLIWSVRPIGGGDPVMSGELESFTAYSATGTAVATRTAQRDAEDRLMALLADRLVARLYARAGELAP